MARALGRAMGRFMLLAAVLGGLLWGAEVRAEDCRQLWQVKRRVRETCWVAVSARDREGPYEICIPRLNWTAWLSSKTPGCLLERPEGRWSLQSINLFDEAAPPEGKPRLRRWLVRPGARTFGDQPGGILTRVVQAVERRREQWSKRLSVRDSEGWYRSWFLGESLGTIERPGTSELFFLLGFVHVLTTAGVHLLMLAAVLEGVIARSGGYFSLWFPGQSDRLVRGLRGVASLGAWALFFWVWALSGWRWGLLRPLGLIAIQRVSRWRGIYWNRGVPLILAVLLEALLAVLSREEALWGRAHYFLAVWGGLWGSQGRMGWRAHLGMAWGSFLWVMPLGVLHEHWVALATAPLSLLTIPVVGYLLFPLGLLAEAFPSQFELLGLFHAAGQALLAATKPLALVSGAAWRVSPAPFAAMLLAVLWIRTDLWRRLVGFRRGLVGLIVLVLLFRGLGVASPVSGPGRGRESVVTVRSAGAVVEKLIQLDVGQGDAALIFWRERGYRGYRRVAAIDVGSGWASGPKNWIGALAREGYGGLDAIVLTHLDEDHAGALEALLPWVRVGCVVMPKGLEDHPDSADRWRRLREQLERFQVPLQTHPAGCFPFYWAEEQARAKGGNAVMAGVAVPLPKGGWYVNLGDSGTRKGAREAALLGRLQEAGAELAGGTGPRIWKVSHHGSRFSSAPSLWGRRAPTEAWISSGASNRFGHPHPGVEAAFRSRGVQLRRTDREGALIYQSF